MNLPNKLTILRVIMIPFFLYFLINNGDCIDLVDRYVALIIFVLASLTDLCDGYIARKYNMVTNFGKFMDPLADKLLVNSALICFVEAGAIAGWIVIVIISREFIVSGLRMVASNAGKVIAASWWGKWKTTVQMIMIILLILPWKFVFHGINWFYVLQQIFIYLALVLTLVSMIDYLWKNRSILSERG